MTDKSEPPLTVFIEPSEVRPDILAHQVENCPTCQSELFVNYGLAGGGIGTYGYCDSCDRIVWKCITED